MKYNQFVLKVMKFNFQKYFIYFFSITFSMTVFFLFTTIWFVPEFSNQTSSGTKQIVQIGGVISSLFSIFIISYSYNHFFKSRTKEFGILIANGLLFRDLKRMTMLENTFLFLFALCTAFITGSLFSRLIFMISTTILGIEDIHFALTYKSFLLTGVCFAFIYLLVNMITIQKIRRYSVIRFLKEYRVSEMKQKGRLSFFLIGLILIISSLSFLYVYNSDISNVSSMKKVTLFTMLVCVLGVYLFISHLMTLLYAIWKKNEGAFYKNILPLSDFASRLSKNRSIMLIVSILSIGIVLFSVMAYTLYNESYEIADNEQLFDVVVKDYEAVHWMNNVNVKQLLNSSDAKLEEQQKLNLIYAVASNINHSSWRTNKEVVISSVSEINKVLSMRYSLKQGEALTIDFATTDEKEESLFQKKVVLTNGDKSHSFIQRETKQIKLFDRYLFSQPVLIILNNADFNQLSGEVANIERGTIYFYKFTDWKKSGKFVKNLNAQLTKSLKDDKDHAEIISEIQRKYTLPFIVHSKYDRYAHVKEVAGFTLFMMGFICTLFIVTVCIVLYFNVFSNHVEDEQKIRLLHTIGITKSEIRDYLNKKLVMMIIFPVMIGSGIGLCLCVSINLSNVVEMELPNMTILYNGIKIVGIYIAFIGVYYYWLQLSYRSMMEKF
jgi:ABC-type antimicrobial peptide transport system permease subunit